MNRLLPWLLDLDQIRLGRDAPLLLKWQGSLPAWLLLGGAVVALACVVLIYRRERGSAPQRVVLAVLRCLVLTLVGVVLCRPALVLQRNRIERSHVAVLLDTSRSMAMRDTYADEALAGELARGAGLSQSPSAGAGQAAVGDVHPVVGGAHPTVVERLAELGRLALGVRVLLQQDAAPLRELLARNNLRLYTFAESAGAGPAIAAGDSVVSVAEFLRGAEATGTATDLAGALNTVLADSEGRRLAGILLISDGQATGGGDLREVADRARARGVPIHPLRLGSPRVPLDVEVGPLRAEASVFVHDLLAVEAQVAVTGSTAPVQLPVQLVDDRTGVVLVTQPVELGPQQPSATVELRTRPAVPGVQRYRVQVEPRPGEAVSQNNLDRVEVLVGEDRVRVLYVEGYPRFEYRYLKNALLREPTVRLSVLLLEADPEFVQEGAEPIRRFPETAEELDAFDVVLFGDVDPRPAGDPGAAGLAGWLTAGQMKLLLDFVGHRGGGFGLLAGERAAPQHFLGTPLEKLLPVRIDPDFASHYAASRTGGYRPQLTPEGRASRLFRFAEQRDESERLLDSLPELFWIARTQGPRPGAAVLLEHPTQETMVGKTPLVVLGRYGAGRLFFQATDDTWRWRRHTGEFLHDTYWVRVVRELMPTQRLARDRRYEIRPDRREYDYGQPVRVQVEILDTRLEAEIHDGLSLVLRDADDFVAARFEASRLAPGLEVFEGMLVPARPGRFLLEVENLPPAAGAPTTGVPVRVREADLEARRPQADHETLARLAEGTGGTLLQADRLPEQCAALRDRSVQIPDDVTEPLWDSKLVLILFVVLTTMEWGLRKAFALL
ncbi:MAG TPA: hypothetical protein PKK06_07785 [Phycisphaerae bacterium]|nr:hypothetical protein [Phycisphaerae bacterium]HNU46063.1 hypothetical protein [Phycisphaerae bacterium]